eukprot:2264696-Rhodomonas_salina.1
MPDTDRQRGVTRRKSMVLVYTRRKRELQWAARTCRHLLTSFALALRKSCDEHLQCPYQALEDTVASLGEGPFVHGEKRHAGSGTDVPFAGSTIDCVLYALTANVLFTAANYPCDPGQPLPLHCEINCIPEQTARSLQWLVLDFAMFASAVPCLEPTTRVPCWQKARL